MSLESTVELFLIALKIDEEFEWKLNCSSKNDMRNLAIFYQSTSFKIGTLMTSLCLNSKMYELKVYRKVMRHDNEEWSKMWRGIDLSVQNWHEEFDEFWPEHSKISKICTLMGCFWPKYIMFELKKVQRSYVWWHWRLMQNLKENWLVLSKMTWRIWQIFVHRLKNSDFILERKVAELNQNKNWEQPDRPDAVWKLYFTLEINE